MIERGAERWYTLAVPSVEVPQKFHVALSFNAHQTKGIYVGIDKGGEEPHSLIGLPDRGYKPVTEGYDWMVRVYLVSDAQPMKSEASKGRVSKREVAGVPVETIQLTDNDYRDHHPRISGSNVVWGGPRGDASEIWLYDGQRTRQISKNTRSGGRFANDLPAVDGSNVVWMGIRSERGLARLERLRQRDLPLQRRFFHDLRPRACGCREGPRVHAAHRQ